MLSIHLKTISSAYKLIFIFGIFFVVIFQYWITVPHLHESTTFLADQLDQILHIQFLFKGHTKLFYGPYWSGTNPPVYGIGFIPSLLFGIPGILGADPETIHLIQFSLIVFSSIPLILIFRKFNDTLPWIFLAFLLMCPSYWWALTLFWINSFLPALGIIFLSAYVYYLKKPSLNRLLLFWSAFLLPLHIHSTPVVVFPAVLHATIHYFLYHKKMNLGLRIRPIGVIAIMITILPFIFLCTKPTVTERSLFNVYASLLYLALSNYCYKPDKDDSQKT